VGRYWRLLTWGLGALSAVCVVVVGGALAYPLLYSDRIYPGVSVHGVDVGGLTVAEATAALIEGAPDPAARVLMLRVGEQTWQLSWADVGQGYDHAGAAARAYQVARQGAWHERVTMAWRVRWQGRQVELPVIPADPARVVAVLDGVAADVSVLPVDARLQIGPDGVVSFPAQPGRALDVQASASRVLGALADGAETPLAAAEGAAEVELVTTTLSPRLTDLEPAHALARSLVAQPFILVADDPLTDYVGQQAQFVASPTQVAGWLRAVPEYGSGEARMALEVDDMAVRAWLDEVAPQVGPERLLDVTQTLTRAVAALAAGEHRAQACVRHPESTYVVQPGDNVFDIAYNHGFPQWRLEQANPDVDPDALAIGMELTIPSIDVLFPHPLVPEKRIEIDLPEQRLRAYEGEQLVYEFTCSSGMTSTPTIAGQFQVLFKEPMAHASRWSLDMPYFLGVYQEGPDFANGIHELPITAGGRRLWEGVLGWPASYGCIILNVGDAQLLYDWAPVGTLVRITGVAPGTPVYSAGDQEGQ